VLATLRSLNYVLPILIYEPRGLRSENPTFCQIDPLTSVVLDVPKVAKSYPARQD